MYLIFIARYNTGAKVTDWHFSEVADLYEHIIESVTPDGHTTSQTDITQVAIYREFIVFFTISTYVS